MYLLHCKKIKIIKLEMLNNCFYFQDDYRMTLTSKTIGSCDQNPNNHNAIYTSLTNNNTVHNAQYTLNKYPFLNMG